MASAPNLVPWPARYAPRPGGPVRLGPDTVIEAPAALRPLADRLRAWLWPATGLPLPVGAGAGGGDGARVVLGLDLALGGALGPEGYRLQAGEGRIAVTAAAAAGIFYGLQTLRQLLPPAVFSAAPMPGVPWHVPALEIEDRPRFAWRGSHLDVARHFQPVELLLKHLDLMALHKLNVFHWHLTDDQGWRLQVLRHPRLTEVGAFRDDSALGPPPEAGADGRRVWRFRGRPHGGFYTQEQARLVVRYAAERFITVVPEIEMPGHARAALAAYPQLGNGGEARPVATTWGVFEQIFSPAAETLGFLEEVLEEVLEIFPAPFIHLGGDEVPREEWRRSPAAQARLRALGLRGEGELQGWFTRQMGGWLAGRGRRLVGWEEILEGGLAPGAVVMAWQSVAPALAAARRGHDVVLAPTEWTYFDYRQSEDPREPVAIGGHLPLEKVFEFDPLPDGLRAELAPRVLGGQAQIWTEYLPTPGHVEYMAWPRLCALAEAVWSPRPGRSFADFRARLEAAHLERLAHLQVGFRPLAGPLPTAWGLI